MIGRIGDRVGRKPVMVVPWLVLLVIAVPGFWLTAHYRTTGALIGLTAAITICACIAEAAILVSVTESLPANIRCGALGLIYASAISVFGGTAQFAVAWLTDLTGSPLAPAWYLTGAVAITLVAMSQMPESAPRKPTRRQAPRVAALKRYSPSSATNSASQAPSRSALAA